MVAKKSSTDETAAEGKQLSLLTDVTDGIVVPIMQSVNKCLRLVIAINMYNPNLDREATLREVTVELKVLATYIDAACQARHITPHKCEVWQRQVNGVDNLAVGLAMGLQRNYQTGTAY